jgi:crossover junction endodeoxyribonuclease RuvC
VGITVRQFENLQKRFGNTRRTVTPARSISVQTHRRSAPRIILGIDPSLRGTGYGIIRSRRQSPTVLAQGTITCPPAWVRSRCLAYIAETLRTLIREHQPGVGVVEGLFYAQNLKTALIMGEARGAALVAAAEAGIEIFEIAPRKVKQAIVGYGGAHKIAVARMVQRMLNLADTPAPDAADALALALAYAHESRSDILNPPKRL